MDRQRVTSLAPLPRTLSPSLPTPPETPHTEDNVLSKVKREIAKSVDHRNEQSQSSLSPPSSARSKQEYMDSLVPPSSDEMSRISQVQLQRQQEEKRKFREKEKELRKSAEVSRSSLDVENTPKHRSSIFNRRRKTESSNTGHSSVAAAAIASVTASGADPNPDDLLRHRAATLIQRTYRGYKTRREMKGLGLNADTRWTQAIREMRFREMTTPKSRLANDGAATQDNLRSPGSDDAAATRSSSARYKWRKVAIIAGRAAQDMDDDTSSIDSDSENDSELSTSEKQEQAHRKREEAKARRRKDARMIGLQYFLEMVDLKHRYGSNLRTYHEEWKKSDTKENFFYWLDYGEGRNVDMTACPRERLDREQVRYLSREERQYYLVQVDANGRLCWAKNGARIDTTEKWKDSIKGIVPAEDSTPAFRDKLDNPNQNRHFQDDESRSSSNNSNSSSSRGASESELEAARAAKYASPGFTDAKGYKKVTHLSASTIFNTLLRKSVRKNTWIFVADTNFRLYVGIKDSGAFQHSSFLQGSRISAAGLIKIKNGRLTSLSPLSGHYRPPASNFRAFVRNLKEEGVDMSHVSISKSYAVLVGLEMYMKSRKKGKSLVNKITHKKDKVLHPEEVEKRIEEERDKSQSAEKERRFLEKQAEEEEKRREENRAAVRVMQKLGITPAVPQGQKGEEAVAEAEVTGAKETRQNQMGMERARETEEQQVDEKEEKGAAAIAEATAEATVEAAGTSTEPAADEKDVRSSI